MDVEPVDCNQSIYYGSWLANNVLKGDVLHIILIRSALIKNGFTKSKYLHVFVLFFGNPSRKKKIKIKEEFLWLKTSKIL